MDISISSSSQSDDDPLDADEGSVEPAVQERIDSIAEILQQTSSNLSKFERLLPAYKVDHRLNERPANGTISCPEASPCPAQPESTCTCTLLKDQLNDLNNRYSELEVKYATSVKEVELLREQIVGHQNLVKELNYRETFNEKKTEENEDGDGIIGTSNSVLSTAGNETEKSTPVERTKGCDALTIVDKSSELELALKTIKRMRESRERLKEKTRQLLKQYRSKRSVLERREKQLLAQKAGLIRLQDLHRSLEVGQLMVLQHAGQQLENLARVVSAAACDGEESGPNLGRCSRDGLALWYAQLETVSLSAQRKVLQKLRCVSQTHQTADETMRLLTERSCSGLGHTESGIESNFSQLFSQNAQDQEKVVKVMIEDIETHA